MTQQQGKPRQNPLQDPLFDRLFEPIKEAIQEVENPELVIEQRAILGRMTTDKRMETVRTLLLSRKRPSREFLHPAKERENTDTQPDEKKQIAALRELFYFSFCCARDKMGVSRQIEVKRSKEDLVKHAKTLRLIADDLNRAIATGQLGLVSAQDKLLAGNDSLALHRVANWLDGLASAHRRPGDPLLVKRHRGDSVVRGVQILIATKMEELFGDRLDRTTATLTSVVLGKGTSVKTTRSAFNTKKLKKRA